MSYNKPYTPEFITSLQPNEVFVFGSNIHGMHGGGVARIAHMKFGAEWGVGEGLTGRCYALPTMEGGVDYIAKNVHNFIQCAKVHPELTFYVTKIACDIAGFTVEEGLLTKMEIGKDNYYINDSLVNLFLNQGHT